MSSIASHVEIAAGDFLASGPASNADCASDGSAMEAEAPCHAVPCIWFHDRSCPKHIQKQQKLMKIGHWVNKCQNTMKAKWARPWLQACGPTLHMPSALPAARPTSATSLLVARAPRRSAATRQLLLPRGDRVGDVPGDSRDWDLRRHEKTTSNTLDSVRYVRSNTL